MGLGIISYVAVDVRPEFDKASKGFETRGSALAARIYTYDRSIETSQCAGKLSQLPNITTYNTFSRLPLENAPWPTCPYVGGQTNICKYSYDGVCDECNSFAADGSCTSPNQGGPAKRVRCAFGTDCFDCGQCPEQYNQLTATKVPPAPPANGDRRLQLSAPSPPCTPPDTDRYGAASQGGCCAAECEEPRDPSDPLYSQYPIVVMCRSVCSSPPPASPPPPPLPADWVATTRYCGGGVYINQAWSLQIVFAADAPTTDLCAAQGRTICLCTSLADWPHRFTAGCQQRRSEVLAPSPTTCVRRS